MSDKVLLKAKRSIWMWLFFAWCVFSVYSDAGRNINTTSVIVMLVILVVYICMYVCIETDSSED